MTIRRTIVTPQHDDDKDDDDEGIPPEILELMRMTEGMMSRPSPMSMFGGPSSRITIGGRPKVEEKIER